MECSYYSVDFYNREMKTLKPVFANRGVATAYKRSLLALIEEMGASVEYWLVAAYKKQPPAVAGLAEDASPANEIRKILDRLAKRWLKRFDEAAPKISEAYVRKMFKASDSAMRAALKDAGWTIKFKLTKPMRDALNASISENISLIKSIPEEYLKRVEGVVYRSYSSGRDLETMVKGIRRAYPVTVKRASFIARDQSNKLNAATNRTRKLELGITQAIWMHSHAGKKPRPSHVAADGKVYDVAKGMYLDGKWTWPGVEPNCRCSDKGVLLR